MINKALSVCFLPLLAVLVSAQVSADEDISAKDLWQDLKHDSKEVWEEGKQVPGKVWEGTKEGAGEVWETMKEGGNAISRDVKKTVKGE
ncbi:MAG: hypothetical protein DIZ78_00795 [endosymbiont of Escarpia spicata]|uniref:CsbD family protein n=1 Tax=endosymbiont of Escarpia spicata TaxID=2200908 RepID=A0A370DTG4_9GAMM|nr:MAG: hypothetical protein DIZ78_00795 [endosymbiont of Escarpia spicata]